MPISSVHNTLHRVKSSFPVVYGGSVPPRFGALSAEQEPALLNSHELKQYEPVIRTCPSIREAKRVDLVQAYQSLPSQVQQLLARLKHEVTPQRIAAYCDAGRLGALEEGADLLYEIYALKALESKIVRPGQMQRWLQDLRQARQTGQTFAQYLAHIEEGLCARRVGEFQGLTGLKNPEKSRQLLALIAFKLVLFQYQDPKFDGKSYTSGRIPLEMEELAEHMPRAPIENLEKILLAGRMLHARARQSGERALETLPSDRLHRLQRTVIDQVSRQVGLPVTHEDLMQYILAKQAGRQERDYELPDDVSGYGKTQTEKNAERRCLVKGPNKPFEVLYEAKALREAEKRLERQYVGNRPYFL